MQQVGCIIAIIAIIAIALTEACPIRYHTLASDSTRGRRDLPFDRGALPKRYVGVSRTLPRRLGAMGTRWCPPCRGFRRSALRVVAPNHRMTCESPDFTVLALAFARDSNQLLGCCRCTFIYSFTYFCFSRYFCPTQSCFRQQSGGDVGIVGGAPPARGVKLDSGAVLCRSRKFVLVLKGGLPKYSAKLRPSHPL